MRIQVNGRYLAQRVTGVQRYAREIVSRLGDRVEIISPASSGRGLRGHLWEQAVLPCRIQRGLLWSPSNTGPLAVRDQVITLHDTAFVDQARTMRWSFAAWYRWLVPRLARRARAIITVSQFSAQRIADYCQVPSEKIHIVPNGVDDRFRQVDESAIAAARHALALPPRYCLAVATLEPRKNLRRLLAAWRIAAPQLPGHQLLIAGAAGHVFRNAGLAEPTPRVTFCGYIEDRWLPALYAGAECFVFPSLYEGFGLPVLEAMAAGAPVVCSSATALPEVAGDAACFVNPLDPESIAAALVQVLSSPTLQNDLRQRGFIQAKRFSWDDAAQRTWQVLTSAL